MLSFALVSEKALPRWKVMPGWKFRERQSTKTRLLLQLTSYSQVPASLSDGKISSKIYSRESCQ